MRRFTVAALALATIAVAGSAQADDGPCVEWREAGLIDGLTCTGVDRGVVIAPTSSGKDYAGIFPIAFERFAQVFAPTDQKIALVVQPEVSKELASALAADGYKALPWVDGEARAAMLKASIVKQIEAQTASLPEAQRAAVSEQALAKANASAPAIADPVIEAGSIAHEIGHLLFNSYFDGAEPGSTDGTPRYGSRSPDWLDEAAAVALENETLTRSRYANARAAFAADGTVLPIPVQTYLTMDHPSLRAAQAIKGRGGEGAKAVSLSGDEAKAFLEASGGNPVVFYRQTRLFIDFLTERSGNPRILFSIAKAYRDGGDLAGWLAQSGGENGLPTTLDGLETEFEAWARTTLAQDPADEPA
ncbi:hypothetical protein [Erythrobacter sp. YJ-T3-07]|uniref:hypothetical protein n=1 Tax=Erythrobacter sp. YJ-T3-07 TaxID=2793063 RepID=UPI0018F8CDB9|nr:hypothetical protein [Erythrobacter sp. YJ-T3-07]